jgi:hypothetical protein
MEAELIKIMFSNLVITHFFNRLPVMPHTSSNA